MDITDKNYLLGQLQSTGAELAELYRQADLCRQEYCGDAVFLRGIVEFSNICGRDCLYCGIRRSNLAVQRYRMTSAEILSVARQMPEMGQRTIVLQAGEVGTAISDREIGQLVKDIKDEVGLAVTLSVGERSRDVYAYWRDCGLDRYLMRFETSDAALFSRLRPGCSLGDRLNCLALLRELGIQVGSGFMIGLPGETLATLVDNLLLCRELQLDMIGVGPFIPHPSTPLSREQNAYASDQEIFFKVIALLRLLNPLAHIPATTAFDAVFPGQGRNLALQRGANIFMPNNTPAPYRENYLLYPGKPCVGEDTFQCSQCVKNRLVAMGRKIGSGYGHSLRR